MDIAPVTRSKDDARANYDRRSRHYDSTEGRLEASCRQAGIHMLGVREGEYVLEIGHGPGLSLIEFARAVGTEGRVTGIDISRGMHDRAIARAAREGVAGRLDLRVGDGARLPFAEESFDVAFMSFTLELFDTPELPVILEECRRVLRPQGRLGIVALELHEHPGLLTRIYLWFHRRFPRFVDCRPIPVTRLVEEAGYGDVRVQRRSLWGLPVAVLVARKAAQGDRSASQ
jgi:ubiquinone/menaquinone biosynthesis C-methylase UbiE